MKRNSVMIIAGMMLLLNACNGGEEKKDESKTADTTATVAAPVVAEPVFQPFKLVIIKHAVKDYAKWKAAYASHDSTRQAYGISDYRLGRGLTDSNMVVVMDKIADVAKAKEFAASANLKDAMQKAGVKGKPSVSFVDVVWNDPVKSSQMDRVMIAHKVKDYDAWKKIFDAEGKTKRLDYGLVDRGLGRGIDDPNMVYIVFGIADMEKAKARIASTELKTLMTDAGVEGAPELFFYKIE